MKDTIHQISLASFSNYIGIPYEKLDCYQLLQKILKDLWNYNLDILYQNTPERQKANALINDEKNKFQKVTIPKLGDIILFKIQGVPCHIGLYLNEKNFLHTKAGVGSCIERYDNWQKRIVGYYRWQK